MTRMQVESGSPYEKRYGFARGVRRGRRVEIAGTAVAARTVIYPVYAGDVGGFFIDASSCADDAEQLRAAHAKAAECDSHVMVERWITGSEYTAAVLGREALPLIRLETPHAFYDYHAKYVADDTRYLIPCGLEQDAETRLQALASKAFDAVGAHGWGRVDILMDDQDRPWIIEINTVPGMTGHSLVPMAAKAAGIGFDELVWRILAQTLEAS